MTIESVIRERRTVHAYKVADISEDTVRTALELALLAPNHKHTQPWLFVDVQPETRAQLIDLGIEATRKKQGDEWTDIKEKALRQKFTNPSRLIVLGQKIVDSEFQRKEDYASVACAVQNMSLYLWSQGIGTKWSTGAITQHKHNYELLGINENEYSIEGFFWMGVAMTEKQPLPPKASLDTLLIKK